MARKVLTIVALFGGLCLSSLANAESVLSAGNRTTAKASALTSLVPTDLRCEYVQNPLAVDAMHPRLFWKLQSSMRDQHQTAYQILVASSTKNLSKDKGNLWNSGKVASNETIQIPYSGRSLKSSQQVFWKVRVWDKNDKVSAWSQPASWTMGLLKEGDWNAKWVTANRTDEDPLPIFRKPIRLGKPVKKAIIHICGLGHYELSINGRRVGDYEMDPGWTNYRKTCLYSSYDVTNMLKQGDNVLGVMLGNGMYNVPGGRYTKFKGTFGPPKLICQMHVTFADGSTRIIASDETWEYALGPIVFTCIFGGEDYDARREQVGWDRPGFDDRAWSAVQVCDGPGGSLVAQYAPPIKVADYLPAVAIQRLEDGQYEVDCGTNLSARPVIKVKGPAGSQVKIMCAEKRSEPWTKRGGHSYTYTLKGEGDEVFRPRFTYFSFQYLYISGVDRLGDANSVGQTSASSVEPRAMLLEAGSEFLTSSADDVGGFECSNALFNDIDAMIDRSVRSNLQSVVTDCPHREKLGWLEVPHLMGPSILYHRDVYRLYQKISRDTTESQLDSGVVPNIAPEYMRFKGAFFESPEWGSTCVQVPNLLYKWYGDYATEDQQYETMMRYTRYLASSRNAEGLVKPGLGDWYDWTPENGHRGASQLTPAELPATAFLYDNARILARVAERMGKKADVAEFDKLARQVRQDFIKAYYKPAEHSVATGSQASLATALYFGLVPEEDREKVLDNLVAELEKAQYRQNTGEICFRMLVQALVEGGRSDVVYRMINRTDVPGYGNMLKLGFKTLSERWDKPGSSMNHCMFGHIQEWFQNSIVGIRQAPDSIGFERLLLRPEIVGELTFASGYYDSVRGRVESRWRIEDSRLYWHVTIPSNTTAEVHIPTTGADKVTESGRPISQAQGVVFLRMEPANETKKNIGYAVFKVGSGEYEFQSPFELACQSQQKDTVYLFSTFRKDGEDGLYLAYSFDGYHWTDLGGGFLMPKVGKKLMRDPSVVQGPDGMFHMVWTTGWKDDKGFGYACSKDLINWSEQKFVEAMAYEPNTQNVWAPELFYDEENKHFIICWSSTIPGRYPDYLEPHDGNHRMYYTTTKDFETFADTKLFFEPGFSVIDGVIVRFNDRYVLVHKDNTRPLRNLRVAFSDNAIGPYTNVSEPFTEQFTEGPTVLRLGDEWVIYFDMYRKDKYGAVKTSDFKTFTDITGMLSFPKSQRHGTIFKALYEILQGLKQHKQISGDSQKQGN